RDPRSYTLVAFGGAGPLHACALADWLGMPRVIVPPNPGVTSAYGLLLTDVRIDLVHTDVQREDRLQFVRISNEFAELEQRITSRLGEEGIKPEAIQLEQFADMRYAGQAYEIRVPLVTSLTVPSLEMRLQQAITTFHASHKDLYGYSYEGKELIEMVSRVVTGLALL